MEYFQVLQLRLRQAMQRASARILAIPMEVTQYQPEDNITAEEGPRIRLCALVTCIGVLPAQGITIIRAEIPAEIIRIW